MSGLVKRLRGHAEELRGRGQPTARDLLTEAADQLEAAPNQGLSEEDGERLENIALTLLERGYHEPKADQAAFLRNLASKSQPEGEPPGCPIHPYGPDADCPDCHSGSRSES